MATLCTVSIAGPSARLTKSQKQGLVATHAAPTCVSASITSYRWQRNAVCHDSHVTWVSRDSWVSSTMDQNVFHSRPRNCIKCAVTVLDAWCCAWTAAESVAGRHGVAAFPAPLSFAPLLRFLLPVTLISVRALPISTTVGAPIAPLPPSAHGPRSSWLT